MTKYIVSNGCCYCGECVFSCNSGAIIMDKDGAHINEEKCIGCGNCYRNCASEAIKKKEG